MIGFLQGRLLAESLEEGKWTIGVGSEQSYVGYTVFIPISSHSSGYHQPLGKTVQLFIHSHIREDQFDLYGFISSFEKSLFLLLLSVSGIGPKSALALLSKVNPLLLLKAITEENPLLLEKVPGIGKKTAEKMVVELKGPLKKRGDLLQWAQTLEKGEESPLKTHEVLPLTRGRPPVLRSKTFEDARTALLGLGYREGEIEAFLERFFLAADSSAISLEEMIRRALQELS